MILIFSLSERDSSNWFPFAVCISLWECGDLRNDVLGISSSLRLAYQTVAYHYRDLGYPTRQTTFPKPLGVNSAPDDGFSIDSSLSFEVDKKYLGKRLSIAADYRCSVCSFYRIKVLVSMVFLTSYPEIRFSSIESPSIA